MGKIEAYAGKPPATAHATGRNIPSGPGTSPAALATAAVASLLASTCCLLPLALVSAGLTGAWLGNLRVLQPYSPVLIGVAIAALALAGRSLFQSRSTASCRVDGIKPRTLYKATFWLVAALTLILLVMPLAAPWFY